MSFWDRLKDNLSHLNLEVQRRVAQFNNEDFATATMAMCALIAGADGHVDAVERRRIAALVESNEHLKVFAGEQLRKQFDLYCNKLSRDFELGKVEAIQAVAKLKPHPDQARAVVQIGIIIGAADGNFDPNERRAVRDACLAVGIPPAEFDLAAASHSVPQTPNRPKIMSVSLTKGGNVSLSKTVPGLKKILIGLGWDTRATDGADFDLDASLFILAANGKVRADSDFIFYNNLKSTDGLIEHTGDNRTGAGEGDDEAIKANLDRLPPDVDKLVVGVTIHEADARRQNFGMVRAAFIRIVNDDGSNQEITRYDLSEDASTETAMIFGEVYRNGTEWKFRAVGQGFKGGLGPMAGSFGVSV